VEQGAESVEDFLRDVASARKHPLANCEECPLFKDGEFVPSVGPKKASLAIVGEAPGAYEAKAGEPFVGESGRLLNAVLKHYKLPRKDIFLSNACLCRHRDGTTPSAKALQACRPRLVAELRSRGVEDVVALGNSSAQSILQTRTGITTLRIGQGQENEKDLPGVRVLCTFHPAAALRQPGFFPSIVTDFGKLKGFTASWYEPKWKAFEYPAEALQALEELQLIEGPVTVDIESGIEKDVSFEQPSRHTLLCVGLEFKPGRGVVIGEVALRFDAVRKALLRYLLTHPIKGTNLKFDLKGLYAKLRGFLEPGQRLRAHDDVMLKSYCLDERGGVHSLGYLGIEKLGTPNWKGVIDKYKKPGESYAVIPRDVLYKYNAFDIHATDMLSDLLDKQLAEYPELVELHRFLCEVSDELMYVELNGIGVDLVYNDELTVQFEASLALLEESIASTIPEAKWEMAWAKLFPARAKKIQQFNPRSPKQVVAVVEDIFDLKLPMKMNQKKEYAKTTDVEALKMLLERTVLAGHPAEEFFRRMLEHRKEAKLYGTYVKGLRKRVYRGRVYPTYLLHGTTSGRLSCRNPNLQNIPRGSAMRRQFVPVKSENVFVEGDFGQNELRVLCWLAQDEYLRGIFNDPDRDLFDELTPRLYGDVSALDPAARKETRIRVKAYVYGLSYGREAYSIALEYKMPVAEAERGMAAFFEVIPATVAFRDETRNKVLNGYDLITPFGRHRRFPLITNANRKDVLNEALSFLPQSIGSDICLDAFRHLRPRLIGKGFIRNLVHDSLLAECHRDDREEVQAIMQEEMLASAARVVGNYVAFKVDFKSGPNWGDLS
jgi:uracil-DNA glycosylase family 4